MRPSDSAESDAPYRPSKKATLDSITYLERTLWPCCNETIKAHLEGIRRFVVTTQHDGVMFEDLPLIDGSPS